MVWSVWQYANVLTEVGKHCMGMQPEVEQHLSQLFLLNKMETISKPCVVVDLEEIVLLWFLPGLLKRIRQVDTLLSEMMDRID